MFVSALVMMTGCATGGGGVTSKYVRPEEGVAYRYGNFCGPGHPAFLKDAVIQADKRRQAALLARERPIDDVDIACKAHDICYAITAADNPICDEMFVAYLQLDPAIKLDGRRYIAPPTTAEGVSFYINYDHPDSYSQLDSGTVIWRAPFGRYYSSGAVDKWGAQRCDNLATEIKNAFQLKQYNPGEGARIDVQAVTRAGQGVAGVLAGLHGAAMRLNGGFPEQEGTCRYGDAMRQFAVTSATLRFARFEADDTRWDRERQEWVRDEAVRQCLRKRDWTDVAACLMIDISEGQLRTKEQGLRAFNRLAATLFPDRPQTLVPERVLAGS